MKSPARAIIVRWRDLDKWIVPKHIFSTSNLPSGWSLVKVGEVVCQVKQRVKVDHVREYRMVGVKWYGEGTFHRETVKGDSLSATYITPLVPNSFIYNRLFAWKGSFAVVPEEHADCFVSNEFPQFIVNNDRILPRYLYLFFMCDATIKAVNKTSIGSSAVSRNRFKEENFLDFEIPLPPLTIQQAIIDRWQNAQEEIRTAIKKVQFLNEQIDRDFLFDLGLKINSNISNKKAFSVWWIQLSRWDVMFAQNIGRDFHSAKYENVRISDVIKHLKDTVRRTNPYATPKEKINYIGLANVEALTGRLVNFSPVIGEEIESSCVVFDEEHILYGKLRPYLRKAITPNEVGVSTGVASSEFLPIKPRENILRGYLAQYLRSLAIEIQARQAIGARMPRISPEALLGFSIPLPSLEIQNQILKKIGKIKADIDKAREAAERKSLDIKTEIEALILGAKKIEGKK
ncbi:MAG: restriction endonuclease subunit S [Nitrospirae bacterium]|nr:restriction endonuclease subunit S [Nitrospirota bacterium]